MEPIVSTLLEEEPDLADLVEEFVAGLPQRLQFLKEVINKRDIDSLKAALHKLKGTSGNYGYPELFTLCQKMEFEVVTGNFANLEEMASELEMLIERIRLGTSPNIVKFGKRGSA